MDAAAVRVTGDLDSVTAPQVWGVLDEALEHARLVVINLREVLFVDSSGLRLLLEATRRTRESGARLVLIGAQKGVERLFALTATRALVDAIPVASAAADGTSAPMTNGGIDPLDNPVNARVVMARVMDIHERALWAHSPDGAIRRAWAPASDGDRVPAGARVEIYLDHQGAVNGWWHTDSRVAVNQRHLTTTGTEQERARALACQGTCELLWQAPAAAQVLDHHERCLTCAGPLVLV
ncbi:STAS domain-containing protein [Solirubrobacter phytolaccae]|uniref:Anti-sigma factor antagonist n=1 Tax=Solirubrobacter phytolaccae TaxID=1404360 RepID=A0A9X3SAE4_9ACTN|nr:STAS domain-containing protein [Solirubrobacter phytolaccae]MDA0184384.1 STAS domain-containing protein [Solirubrobacter phytolaccae]